jgi:hypothetical protein
LTRQEKPIPGRAWDEAMLAVLKKADDPKMGSIFFYTNLA